MSSSAIWFWPGSHNYFLLWSRLQIQLYNIHSNVLSKAGLVNIFFHLFLSWNFFPSNFSSIVIVLQGIIVWVDSCDLSVPVICLLNPSVFKVFIYWISVDFLMSVLTCDLVFLSCSFHYAFLTECFFFVVVVYIICCRKFLFGLYLFSVQ